MHTFADVELDLDEEGLADERGPETATDIIGDRDIRLLLRRNRIALAKNTAVPVESDDGILGYDVTLMCAVHSDPRCRFQWSRLTVDLTPTPTARISDMVPREVVDERPVELTTTVGLGMKFTVASNALGADLSPQYSQKRTVYYPQIVSSGTGFTRGYWDFLTLDNRYLHADRELRLLVTSPPDEPLNVRFQLRAKVKLAGVAGVIPLLARTGAIDETYRLDKE
ncbi:hypothetical protein [Nocardia vaccinii]|uniref:hypothetical protein n=1 Tax=Nocardia vaccinii TaxID=1822 RepID=UPI00082AB636|nr:hypothetical protein [Nocardia vaccinii]